MGPKGLEPWLNNNFPDFWDGSNFELDWFDYRTNKTLKSQYLQRDSNPPVRTGGTTLKTPLLEGFFVFRDIKIKRVINRVTSWGFLLINKIFIQKEPKSFINSF